MQNGIDGYVYVNPADYSLLNLSASVIRIKDDLDHYAYLHIDKRPEVPMDSIYGDINILEENGFQNEEPVEIEPFNGNIQKVTKIDIEFSAIDRDVQELYLPQMQANLKKFLTSYYLVQDSLIWWSEENLKLHITVNQTTNSKDTIYTIDTNHLDIKLHEMVQKEPFNAILLIDKSHSMSNRDMSISDAADFISELKDRYLTQSNIVSFPDLDKYFKRVYKSMQLNSNTKDQISRLESVILATIAFFQEKISRGYGEKCSFILYSDEAKIIQYKNKNYIEASDFDANFCNFFIKTIKEANLLSYSNTNISAAIDLCFTIALEYKTLNKNPLMILILTDGGPFPPEVDSPENVLNSIKKLKVKMNTEKIPFVFYTIGIGKAAFDKNAELLKDLASIGQGEFHKVKGVKDLINWYRDLAKTFAITISFKGGP
jgi:hypothetical protein